MNKPIENERGAQSPNDPKLTDCGATAQPVLGSVAEAQAVTARSSSVQRMVRPIGVGIELEEAIVRIVDGVEEVFDPSIGSYIRLEDAPKLESLSVNGREIYSRRSGLSRFDQLPSALIESEAKQCEAADAEKEQVTEL